MSVFFLLHMPTAKPLFLRYKPYGNLVAITAPSKLNLECFIAYASRQNYSFSETDKAIILDVSKTRGDFKFRDRTYEFMVLERS